MNNPKLADWLDELAGPALPGDLQWRCNLRLAAQRLRELNNECIELRLNQWDDERRALIDDLIREHGYADDDLWQTLVKERNEALAKLAKLED